MDVMDFLEEQRKDLHVEIGEANICPTDTINMLDGEFNEDGELITSDFEFNALSHKAEKEILKQIEDQEKEELKEIIIKIMEKWYDGTGLLPRNMKMFLDYLHMNLELELTKREKQKALSNE